MQEERIWAAVMSLANSLPASGRMSGEQALGVLTMDWRGSELTYAYDDGLEVIAEFEKQIAANPVVTAKLEDNSIFLVKGRDLAGEQVATTELRCNAGIRGNPVACVRRRLSPGVCGLAGVGKFIGTYYSSRLAGRQRLVRQLANGLGKYQHPV